MKGNNMGITFMDVIAQPKTKISTTVYDICLVISGSILVAISAHFCFRLPFTPVPVTGQTFGVLLVAALLGCKRGGISLCLYILKGLLGLPVFAGGNSGILYLLGPTGGYLFGFIIAAFVVGYLAEHGFDKKFLSSISMMFIGNILIYMCGLIWLLNFTTLDKLFTLGLYPFIPGDIIKILLAGISLPSCWKLFGKNKKCLN